MVIYFESFIFILIAELLLTLYSIHSSKGNKQKAAICAGLNTILYCMNIDNLIRDNWCILFAAIGAYVGTWISVKWFENK